MTSKEEMYERLCEVIETTDDCTPLNAIAAAKTLLSTVVLSYYDATGIDLRWHIVESFVKDLDGMINDDDANGAQ